MTTRNNIVLCGCLAMLLASCASHYEVAGVTRTRLLVDSRLDSQPDAGAVAFMQPYKTRVDSLMSPVVGTADHYMEAHQPESELSNLLADILVWGGTLYGEHPDLGVYNMGGIRAAFAKGPVTYGDVVDVAPFENKMSFLTLTGEKLLQLCAEMAHLGGQGVSHGLEMTITRDGRLVTARLNGRDIDPTASYRIVTLDYLAHGNDGFNAFKDKTDFVSPQDEESNVRYIIEKYFREKMAAGQAVNAQVEGRVVVKD